MCRTQPREAIPGCRWRSLGVLLVVLALASGCRRESAEHALRGHIPSLQAAIESRDSGGMAKFLAADFVGNDGLDLDVVRSLPAHHFLHNAETGVASDIGQTACRETVCQNVEHPGDGVSSKKTLMQISTI